MWTWTDANVGMVLKRWHGPKPFTEFEIDHTLALDLQGPHCGDPSGRRRCTKEEEAPAQAAVPLPKVPQGVELALGAQTSFDHAFQREGETGCLSLQVQGVWERIPVEEGLGPAHEASHRGKAPGLLSLWQEVCHQTSPAPSRGGGPCPTPTAPKRCPRVSPDHSGRADHSG